MKLYYNLVKKASLIFLFSETILKNQFRLEKKMKRFLSISMIVILSLLLTGCAKEENTATTNDVNISKLSASSNNNQTNPSTNNSITNVIEIKENMHSNSAPVETEMASFSTKLGGSMNSRTNNINITTGVLNETVVEPGKTFSFCDTVGKPTKERGYQEADAFDKQGNTFQAVGGGNCQVSSTLYNVVLQIPELEVIERHEHSKPVHYVPKDKDAAVATGSVDFKFKNNSDFSIKIYANSDTNAVNIRIVKMQ